MRRTRPPALSTTPSLTDLASFSTATWSEPATNLCTEDPGGILGAEPGADYTGMKHRRRHAGVFESASQLVGEHHTGQLRLVIGRLSGVAALALQVLKVDPSH